MDGGTLELYDDADAELDMSIGSHSLYLTINKSPVRGTEVDSGTISRLNRRTGSEYFATEPAQ